MKTETPEDNYDDEMYTDTAMFDADEIVRSVEEVARQRAEPETQDKKSARHRFEQLMEDRKLAENLKDSFEDDWEDEFSEDEALEAG